MLDDHTDTLEAAIRNRSTITTYSLNTVQLSPSTGYIEGEIIFVDSSRLVFFEFLRQSDAHVDREKYRYHYMDADNQLLFRYDDAPHYSNVATFPHHKHLSTDEVVESTMPKLTEVLVEAETHVLGIP